jgi:hypothetical protein
MDKILIRLLIVQVEYYEHNHPDFNVRFIKYYRVNPYNPISYLLLAIVFPISIYNLGFRKFIKSFRNPFAWY